MERFPSLRRRGKGRSFGFSLVEMLLVVTIFSTFAVVLSQIFVSYNRLHRKVANTALLSQDMRFAMELLVRAARNNQINYAYAPIPAKDTVLHLIASNGSTIDIGLRPGLDCLDTTVTSCLALSQDGGATWQPLTSKRVNVKSFDVFVRPATSPFDPLIVGNDQQPFATMNLSLEYLSSSVKERVSLQAQTTVSSRVYLR